MRHTKAPGTRLPRHRMMLAVILLLATAAFFPGFNWGLPHGVSPETVQPWALDTIAPIAPLNEAYHRFTRAGNEFVVYPLFHYMVLSAAYAPYIGVQYLSGGLTEPASSFPYGVDDIVAFCGDLTRIARLVSLLMGLGIVVLVYRITRECASVEAALWAALVCAMLAPLAYYSTTSNLDVPYAFWVCLAIWQYVRVLKTRQLRNYLLLGAFTGLAVATKDQAYGFFVIAPIALIYAHAASNTQDKPLLRDFARSAISVPMLAAAAACVVAFALGNNLLFGGLDGLLRHLAYGGEIYEYRQSHEVDFYTIGSQATLLGRSLLILLQNLGPGTIALAIFGVFLAWRSKNWPLLSLLVFVVSYYLFVIAAFNMVFARYLLVPSLLLAPFAGVAIARIIDGSSRYFSWRVVLVTLALGWQAALVINLDLTLVNDSRYAMGQWIRENVPPGSVIESQVRTRMLPHVLEDYRVTTVGNSEDSITMAEVAAELTPGALAARNPDYVLVLAELGITGDPAGWSDPSMASYYDDLRSGKLGYKRVAEFATPRFVPYRQIPGTRPTSILFARDDHADR